MNGGSLTRRSWLGGLLLFMAGCRSGSPWRAAREADAATYTLWVGPFAVRTAEPLDEDGPEATALRSVVHEVDRTLERRPVHDPIEVYLFEDRRRYEKFLRAQGGRLPPRRALFVREGVRRKIYAYRSARIARDLRHEATHALLNARYGTITLWIDEGLAEYFEPDPEEQHLQPRHIAELWQQYNQGLWYPNLRQLASKKTVRDFSQRDYAEAWLWSHYLIEANENLRGALVESLRQDRGRSLETLLKGHEPHLLRHLQALVALREHGQNHATGSRAGQ